MRTTLASVMMTFEVELPRPPPVPLPMFAKWVRSVASSAWRGRPLTQIRVPMARSEDAVLRSQKWKETGFLLSALGGEWMRKRKKQAVDEPNQTSTDGFCQMPLVLSFVYCFRARRMMGSTLLWLARDDKRGLSCAGRKRQEMPNAERRGLRRLETE